MVHFFYNESAGLIKIVHKNGLDCRQIRFDWKRAKRKKWPFFSTVSQIIACYLTQISPHAFEKPVPLTTIAALIGAELIGNTTATAWELMRFTR